MEILPELSRIRIKRTRNSVSSEAFGEWNKKGEFKDKVVPKSEETK